MKGFKKKTLSTLLTLTMVAGMVQPMGVNAAWSAENTDSGYLRVANLTAEAPSVTNSEAAGNGIVSAAVDDNTATFWHSSYDGGEFDLSTTGGTTKSQYSYIDVTLPEAAKAVGVTYMPRQLSGYTFTNGAFHVFKVQVQTADSTEWKDVDIATVNGAAVETAAYGNEEDGTYDSGYYVTVSYTQAPSEEQELIFKEAQKNVTAVRLKVKESYNVGGAVGNSFLNAAEIDVLTVASLEETVKKSTYIDISAATEETAAAYKAALAKAEEVLADENATDEEKEAAEKALYEAVAGLKTIGDAEIDAAVLAENAIANSEMNPAYGSDGPASWAFDTNDRWWHSRWGNWDQSQDYETVTSEMTGKPSETNPIWIQTGFGEVKTITKLTYLSRSNAMGIISDYTVAVAKLDDATATPTDDDFTVVKTGKLEVTTATQEITLDEAVEATHVRITATGAYKKADGNGADGDGHVAAKNIKIYEPGEVALEIKADKTALQDLVDAAETVDKDSWTEDEVAAFEAALAKANEVLDDENATSAQIYDAVEALKEAQGKDTAERIKEIVDNMSLEEKIGQKLMLSFRSGWTMEDGTKQAKVTEINSEIYDIIGSYDIGSVILFAANFTNDAEGNVKLTDGLQKAAMDETLGENSIPLLIAADQEGGSVYRLNSGTALPGNMALGATGNLEDSFEAGAIIGRELEAVGVNVNFAPVADVNNNANNPVIGLRSFSSNPQLAGACVEKYIEGIHESNVATTAKHFPGHGNTATDSHTGLPSVSSTLEELYATELVPFEAAIEAGTDMIMTAHIQFPNVVEEKLYSSKKGEEITPPATLSREILTDLLRDEMGFEGVIATDSMTMSGVTNYFDTNEANLYAVKAGVDILDIPFTDMASMDDVSRLDSLIDAFVTAYTEEDGYNGIVLSEEELDASVTRILTAKQERGVLDLASDTTTYEEKVAKANEEVGSVKNHTIEREIAAHAVTVVKNEDDTLPLTMTSNSKVLILCPYNNEIVQATMGWNRTKEAGLVPKGADYKVIRFSSANADINTNGTGYNSDGTTYTGTIKDAIDWADTIIVSSEVSKASYMAYDMWLSNYPNNFVNYAEENGKRTVIMSVDKPYDVQLYPNADAILATYGCKGSSVDITESFGSGAEYLDTAYGPNIIAGYEVAFGVFGATGTLPVDVLEFDNSTDTYTDKVVYELGFGITYDALKAVIDKTELNEAIATYGNVETEKYTEETAAVLTAALEAAKELAANDDATQAEVDDAVKTLTTAFSGLKTSYTGSESDRVNSLISDMTIRQKITQMLMVDFRYWDEDLTDSTAAVGFTEMNDQVQKIIEDYDFGALIYFAQNLKTTEQSFTLTQAVQAAATKDGGIPLLVSADQEGGSVYRLGTGTALPGNMALGATFDTEAAYKAGRIIGSELSVLGINTDLAPVVDVNNNPNNPVIGLRSYGDDATAVGEMASASIKGMAEYNVIGCAKHFPGHGDTAEDSHYGLPIVDKSLDVLKECELKPYEVAIEEGIEMIMTAHILYPQLESDKILSEKTGKEESLPATMSDDIITGLLKGDMGFDGIVCTDAMNMAGVASNWNQVQSVKIAIQAGVDLICMPCVIYDLEDLADLDAIIDGIIEAVAAGEITEDRLNDACTRILTVKENRGILDYDADDYSLEEANATVGCDANRETEREIAAQAVTVVENKNDVLPLQITETTKVLMLCPYNNERTQMLWGWNRAKEAGLIPEGAEVKVVRFSSASIEAIQEDLDWADIYIINSEVSSAARMNGGHWLSAGPIAFTEYAKENGKISVVMSVDKPYDVQSYPDADAVLAAYGCKGSTTDPTEALVGGTGSVDAYGPNIIAGVEVALGVFSTTSGKLPVTIYKFDTASKTYTDEVVYPRGYNYMSNRIDKAALEAAIADAEELTEDAYTAESWTVFAEALVAAKEVAANEDADQAAVDAALEALTAAKEALVAEVKLDPTDDSRDIPVECMTAISESEYSGCPDDNILDGDSQTHWHTNWATTEAQDVEKRWVGVSLEELKEVDGVRYLPRNKGGHNGDVTEYKVQYRTTDDGEWIDIEGATGTWEAQDATWKLITFEPVVAKQVRIVGIHTYADSGNDAHMSTAEFRLTGRDVVVTDPVDKDALNAAIEEAEELAEEDYTAESWAVFAEALEEAKAVAADETADQETVDAAMVALDLALASLEEKAETPVEADKTELEAAIAAAEELAEEDYTAESWTVFAEALEDAKAVLADEDAEQTTVDAALTALEEAAEALVEADVDDGGIYTEKNPFNFPNEKGVTVTLEAELATELINSQDDDSDPNWPLSVTDGDWASGGKFVNCLAYKDFIRYAYNAEVAGTYKVVVYYRSGSNSNQIAWSEVDGKITEGQISAGASDSASETHTVEFELEVTKAGAGVLVLTAPDTGKGPQLDKFEFELVRLEGEAKPVDREALETAISKAEALNAADYVDFTAVEEALAAAKAVYANEEATQEETDAAAETLNAAVKALVKAPTEADKAALKEAIDNAKALNATDYVDFTAVEAALTAAEEVYANEKASQSEVKTATNKLNKAIKALVEVVVEEDEVVRLFGTDRYATGYAAADELKAVLGVEKFDTVIIATGKNYADALSGSYLAAVKNAPILLTNGKAENVAELHAYIKANVTEGGKVYILGGEGAVPKAVEAIEGYDVTRLSGSTRYETNLAILAEAGYEGQEDLLVATGKDFADSLSASAAARPILLVKPNTALTDDQKAVAANFANIYVIGGTGAVAVATEEELAAYGNVTRLSGASRYETSVAVAEAFFTDPETVVLAYGKNFPDGLCGGALAAALNAPLILTKEGNEDAAAAYVAANGIASGYVLGGEGVIPNDTVVTVFALENADEIIKR